MEMGATRVEMPPDRIHLGDLHILESFWNPDLMCETVTPSQGFHEKGMSSRSPDDSSLLGET